MSKAESTQDTTNFPKLLTRAELAKVARTSVETIKRHPETFPPAVRVGRQWRYRADAVQRWLDTGSSSATSSQEGGA